MCVWWGGEVREGRETAGKQEISRRVNNKCVCVCITRARARSLSSYIAVAALVGTCVGGVWYAMADRMGWVLKKKKAGDDGGGNGAGKDKKKRDCGTAGQVY